MNREIIEFSSPFDPKSKVGIGMATLFLGSNATLRLLDYFYICESWGGQVEPKTPKLRQGQRSISSG